jgi:hypothetical protein
LFDSAAPRTQRAITDFFCGFLSNSKLGIFLIATPRRSRTKLDHRPCTDAVQLRTASSKIPPMEISAEALDIGCERRRATPASKNGLHTGERRDAEALSRLASTLFFCRKLPMV